jgi:GH43 family beta-xylosidase
MKFRVINIVLSVVLILSIASLSVFLLKKSESNKALDMKSFLDSETYINTPEITGIGDPYVFRDGDKYYMTATSSGVSFNLWSTTDFKKWKNEGPIFAQDSGVKWTAGELWGPEIYKKDSKYYLFFSAREKTTNSPRIGMAVSDKITGPYKDELGKPLFDFGYAAIDNHLFKDDDGKYYLYFSRDSSENIVDGRHESHIYVASISDDWTKLTSEPKKLISPEQDWELQSGPEWLWNEGPWMHKNNGKYYLFFSANYFAKKEYSIGYAVSDSPTGPFVKYEKNPILFTEADELSGAGNNSIFKSPDGKELFTAYHMHTIPSIGGGDRYLNIDRIGFRKDGTVYVNGPTVTQQSLPGGADAGRLINIAPLAKITATASSNGYLPSALNDGEIGIYPKFEKYEWKTDKDLKGTSISLTWDKTHEVRAIYIYQSAKVDRKFKSVKISFDNGKTVEKVKLSMTNGEAAIIETNGTQTKEIKIYVDELGYSQKELGLSEIMVFAEK